MDGASHIRWGRIAIAAVLSEVVVVAVVIVTTTAYRFLIAPGRTAAEYAAFGELAGYYVAPAAAGLATFFGALWVGSKLTAAFPCEWYPCRRRRSGFDRWPYIRRQARGSVHVWRFFCPQN